jgi:hypothetical protein
MSDITVIMAGPSTSLVLMEFEISKFVNEILDDAKGIVVQVMIVTVMMIRLN